jgi:hypothetical protein
VTGEKNRVIGQFPPTLLDIPLGTLKIIFNLTAIRHKMYAMYLLINVLYSVQVRYETDHEPDVPSCQFMIPTQNVQIDFHPQALGNGTFEFHHPTGEGFPIFFLPLCISYQANHFVLKNLEAVRSVTLCGSLFCDRKNALSYFCNLKSMTINHEFQLQNFSTSAN